MTDWLKSVRGMKHRGFVGPKYRGLWGKVRLLLQGCFGHEEIISWAEPTWWHRPEDVNPNVSLLVVGSFEQAEPHLVPLREAYSRDFSADWKSFFAWGQTLTLAFLEGRLAAFGWLQDGSKRSAGPYLPLLPGEYRLLRGGVLPGFRGRGVHKTRYVLVLEHLFSIGARRVYIDAFTDNVFSWRAQHEAGFREAGRVRVRRSWTGHSYVRWLPARRPESKI